MLFLQSRIKSEEYILANKVFDEKLSVRDTEKLVKEIKKTKKKKEKPVIKNDFVFKVWRNV